MQGGSIPIEYYEKYLFPSFWLQVHILYLENTREALEAYLLSLWSFISAKWTETHLNTFPNLALVTVLPMP